MADAIPASTLVRILKAEGCKVVEVRDWRDHNRNHKGGWEPINGVMIHHTVTRGTANTVDICYDGYSSLPGPLCHGVIAKSGTVYLVGNGRANHAGGGDPRVLAAVVNESYGDTPPGPNRGNRDGVDGNAHFYGFECENLGDGRDPWPAAQLEAIERASAAILRHYGWSSKSVIGHREWSNDKIDPRGFSMVTVRERIAARLAGKSEGDDDMPSSINTWGTLDATHSGGHWHRLEFKDGAKAIVKGPGAYSVTVSLYLDDVPEGAQIQGRFVHEKSGADDKGSIIEAIGTNGKSFPQFVRNGHLNSGETLQFELLVIAAGNFTSTWRVAEGHYWK